MAGAEGNLRQREDLIAMQLRPGNLVKHRSGGPIMVVDREVSHSSNEPLVSCSWVEAGQRHSASFKEDSLQAVNGDGSPRDYEAET
ncbi:putative small protein (DUF2158) [Bradyrhizobium sp. YR681]|uniref:hypothetical protein n=1 Tax=Bradyrhizobium sp. YR681 TaxID=1144344 RepID=UPI000270D7F9|nr:hypothetical protein [Bradyrhizobium sp. YR681]EJN11542.1 putative small protein (DUF2158) [Bradyrhizobium sp. YR681]